MAASVATTTTARPPATTRTTSRAPAAPESQRERSTLLASQRGLLIAGSLSLGAGLVHLYVAPTHWFTWWGYGQFFLLSGIAQVLYAPAVVRWPNPVVVWLGIVGNLSIVGLYLVTRTNGIPFGPSAGHIERVGVGDFVTTAGEFVLAGMLISALGPRARSRAMTAAALGGVALWLLRLTDNLL